MISHRLIVRNYCSIYLGFVFALKFTNLNGCLSLGRNSTYDINLFLFDYSYDVKITTTKISLSYDTCVYGFVTL